MCLYRGEENVRNDAFSVVVMRQLNTSFLDALWLDTFETWLAVPLVSISIFIRLNIVSPIG
jgi:hypothetical protein